MSKPLDIRHIQANGLRAVEEAQGGSTVSLMGWWLGEHGFPALLAEVDRLRARLVLAGMVIEAARRHECTGGYQRTVWAWIVEYDELCGRQDATRGGDA